jgi:hypothetical protein
MMLLQGKGHGRRYRHSKALAGAAPADADGGRERGRFSARRRRMETILRMLRGEPLDGPARELGVARPR